MITGRVRGSEWAVSQTDKFHFRENEETPFSPGEGKSYISLIFNVICIISV